MRMEKALARKWTIITLTQLNEITETLGDIHSQFDTWSN